MHRTPSLNLNVHQSREFHVAHSIRPGNGNGAIVTGGTFIPVDVSLSDAARESCRLNATPDNTAPTDPYNKAATIGLMSTSLE
jgi:hypothetical protein